MNYLYNNFLTPVEVDKIHDTIFNINFPFFMLMKTLCLNQTLVKNIKILIIF